MASMAHGTPQQRELQHLSLDQAAKEHDLWLSRRSSSGDASDRLPQARPSQCSTGTAQRGPAPSAMVSLSEERDSVRSGRSSVQYRGKEASQQELRFSY